VLECLYQSTKFLPTTDHQIHVIFNTNQDGIFISYCIKHKNYMQEVGFHTVVVIVNSKTMGTY